MQRPGYIAFHIHFMRPAFLKITDEFYSSYPIPVPKNPQKPIVYPHHNIHTAGSFLRYLDRGPKVLFFENKPRSGANCRT